MKNSSGIKISEKIICMYINKIFFNIYESIVDFKN